MATLWSRVQGSLCRLSEQGSRSTQSHNQHNKNESGRSENDHVSMEPSWLVGSYMGKKINNWGYILVENMNFFPPLKGNGCP